MRSLNIAAKIWLSIGIFVLGYVLSTVSGQVQGLATEATLRTTSEASFPAAQGAQDAEAAFQRVVKAFSDAVMVQDATGLDRAAEEGKQVVEGLKRIAAIRGLDSQRAEETRQLASSTEQFMSDARSVYAAVVSNPASLTGDSQQKMRDLADRTDQIKGSLSAAKDRFSKDLHERLASMQQRSVSQRWLGLGLFATTLLVSAVIVTVTIRRTITGPITRVIEGVRQAADMALDASARMAQSGQAVSKDAQEQAACIEETSASLEEISATTRENAQLAGNADKLMQAAGQTVNKATKAMNELMQSMDAISKSSQQVSDVLKSIDEIAFHTNILALNAAVEAARAGQAGAGFSVVADEVRALAHRAAEAAQRSAEIIEKTVADVKNGVELVGVAHTSFQEVSSSIGNGSQLVSQIAAGSDQQSRGVSHVGTAISRIETVTQNNVVSAQQTAEAASAMDSQLQTTRELLNELVAVVGMQRS